MLAPWIAVLLFLSPLLLQLVSPSAWGMLSPLLILSLPWSLLLVSPLTMIGGTCLNAILVFFAARWLAGKFQRRR